MCLKVNIYSSSGSTNSSSVDNIQDFLSFKGSQSSLETSLAGPTGNLILSPCNSDETLSIGFSDKQEITTNILHKTNQQRKLNSETKTPTIIDHRNCDKKEMEEDLSMATVGENTYETESEMAFVFHGSSMSSKTVLEKTQSGVLLNKDFVQTYIDSKLPQLDYYNSDTSRHDFVCHWGGILLT